MKKLISIAAALSMCIAMAGGIAADRSAANSGNGAFSACAAEEQADYGKGLPKKFKELREFVKENGTVSVQNGCLVFCGNIAGYSVMDMGEIMLTQKGEGAFEEKQVYEITDDGIDDGSGNVVAVYKPVKAGRVHIMVTCADAGRDGGAVQCLIDRECIIGEDMSVTLCDAPSMENLIYSAFMNGYSVFKAHEQIKGAVNIPEKIGNVPVYEIAPELLKYYDGVTSVTLPASIGEIPEAAFELCYDLETITINDPDCKIEDSEKTISNVLTEDNKYTFTGTIRGYKGSTAEKYAKKYGYKFEEISSGIDDILPKDEYEMRAFVDKYGAVSMHGKYLVAYKYFFEFYDHGGAEFKGFDTMQSGEGKLKLVKAYDVGNTAYPCAANVILVYEACEAGDVEFMAVHNRMTSGNNKDVVAHEKLTIAEDMTITDSEFKGVRNYALTVQKDGTLSVMPTWAIGDLVIPSEIMGMKVTSLHEDCNRANNDLVTAVIPETVEWIGPNSFACCPMLERIVIKNPDCVIAVNEDSYDNAICNRCDINTGWECTYDGVICGYKGSTAEKFAKERGYRFEDIEAANGDINGDGAMTVADAVLLQKWLLGGAGEAENIMYADLCKDGVIDCFDLCLMRKKLVEAPVKEDDFIRTFEVYDIDTGKPAETGYVEFDCYIVTHTDDGNKVSDVMKTVYAKGEPMVFDGKNFADDDPILKFVVTPQYADSGVEGVRCDLVPDKTETVNGVTRLYVQSKPVA